MRWVALFVAVLCVGCATTLESRGWIQVETAHFRLISDAGRREAVQIAQGLELLRALLDRVGLAARLEPRVPLLVYVFRDAAAFSHFRPRPGVESILLHQPEGSLLVVHSGAGVDARATALHEYVHFVLRNGEATQYPMWYDEGLAEFASTLVVRDDYAVVGTIPTRRARWVAYGSSFSLRSVMLAEDSSEWPERALDRFHAQAWALVHFFHLSDRAGFPNRQPQMIRYIALLNRGVDPEQACQQAFQASFEELETELQHYLGQAELPYLGLTMEGLEVADAYRVRALPEPEKQRRLGELALALGEAGRDEARLWLGRWVASAPRDGRAHAALARASFPADRAAADAHFATALSLAGDDADVHRLYAESLLERATAAETRDVAVLVAQARRSFQRSIELDPQQVAAYAGLGRSYLVAPGVGDPAEGLAALRTAHQRLPGNRSISLWLAQLETSAGSVKNARRVLNRMTPPSHGEPVGPAEHAAVEQARQAAGLPQLSPQRKILSARLDVDAPRQGDRVRGLVGWVEVKGRGGLWESLFHDVVIAIDESSSTLLPTGIDLDGDGEIGRTRVPRWLAHTNTDPEDAVMHAEFEAARALIRQLDPSNTRVAIVSFAGESNLVAPLGTPEAALERLEEHPIRADRSGTSLASALRGALDAFFDGRDLDVRRQRTVILLSDGRPTVPSEIEGREEALDLADRLGEIGVPVHAFALGKVAREAPEFYRTLAGRSGGEFVPVEEPANVVNHLANLRFTGLEDVSIRSAPVGKAGRAVRVFPDGSFDAYAPLVEGENVISITASLTDGRTLSETRTVFFERPAEPGPRDEQEAARLREQLQNRALELELLAETRERSRPQQRRIDLDVER